MGGVKRAGLVLVVGLSLAVALSWAATAASDLMVRGPEPDALLMALISAVGALISAPLLLALLATTDAEVPPPLTRKALWGYVICGLVGWLHTPLFVLHLVRDIVLGYSLLLTAISVVMAVASIWLVLVSTGVLALHVRWFLRRRSTQAAAAR